MARRKDIDNKVVSLKFWHNGNFKFAIMNKYDSLPPWAGGEIVYLVSNIERNPLGYLCTLCTQVLGTDLKLQIPLQLVQFVGVGRNALLEYYTEVFPQEDTDGPIGF